MRAINILFILFISVSCNVKDELKKLWESNCAESKSTAFENLTLKSTCNGNEIVSTILRSRKSLGHKSSTIKYLQKDLGLNLKTYREKNTGNSVDHLITRYGNCDDIKYFTKNWDLNTRVVNNQGETILFSLMKNSGAYRCEVNYKERFDENPYIYVHPNNEGKTPLEYYLTRKHSASDELYYYNLTKDPVFIKRFIENTTHYIDEERLKYSLELIPLIENMQDRIEEILAPFLRRKGSIKVLEEIFRVHAPDVDISQIYYYSRYERIIDSIVNSTSKVTYTKKVNLKYLNHLRSNPFVLYYNSNLMNYSRIKMALKNRKFLKAYPGPQEYLKNQIGNNLLHELILMQAPTKLIYKMAKKAISYSVFDEVGRDGLTVLELAKEYDYKLYKKMVEL